MISELSSHDLARLRLENSLAAALSRAATAEQLLEERQAAYHAELQKRDLAIKELTNQLCGEAELRQLVEQKNATCEALSRELLELRRQLGVVEGVRNEAKRW